MSFIYSRALVEEYLVDNSSDIDASALSSESHTLKPSWWHDKTMEPSRHSRFGMMYAPLTERLGMALSTWFVVVSLAKTYQSPETGPDWTAKGQGYGEKWRGLLAKYNPDTHSLKTAQLSLLEDLTGCCATLPRWGLMLDGELYQQPIPALFMRESESGYWPTPTVCGNHNRKGASATSGDGLATVVKKRMYPTPTAHNAKETNAPSESNRNTPTLAAQCGGLLNPDWVEWLMGWPTGHTDLKPLETDKLAEWQQQHSPCYMANKEAA